MRAIDVSDSSRVAEARRIAVGLAKSQGFSEEDAGRVAIVVTELATNLIKHGGGGALLIGSYDDPTGYGVECLALDKGEGMADLATAMRDGYSTANSPGTGLGAVIRGAHVTEIYTVLGAGTAILARLAPGRPDRSRTEAVPSYGVVNVAMAGEEICGDSWSRKAFGAQGWSVIVADGLGHGPMAAVASKAATQRFIADDDLTLPSEMLAVMHGALRSTRGAAVAIARFDPALQKIVFAGVGNVAAVVVEQDLRVHRMVSHNGTIGHIAKHMRDFDYTVGASALLILASDGLGTSWRLDAYPGLMTRHPTLIAGVLYRDFNRGRDDVTVLVSRLVPS